MALTINTTIRHMDEFSRESWEAELGNGDDFDILMGCQEDELEVEVVSIETDGYYNVKTPSGRIITGLSWYHLDGFDPDGIPALRME